MPNWCQGVLKIRGPKENHLNFIKFGLVGLEYSSETHFNEIVPIETWWDKNEEELSVYKNPGMWIWIKDTKRAFLDFDERDTIDGLFYENPDDESDYISVLPIKQAWGIDYEEFAALAKKYELDMRIFAVEQGMGFWCDADIDKTGKNNLGSASFKCVKNYSDFLWECPYPILGG